MSEGPTTRSDHRISVRFGDAILEAGHTAVPNLVLNSYCRLGITPGEMLFVIHIWQHWWTERDPYPSLGTIAARMGISRRQARNHASSLKTKGYLRVNERTAAGRGQLSSEYDFAPLLQAVANLDDGTPGNDSSGGPRKGSSSEEEKAQEDTMQDSNSSRTSSAATEPRRRGDPHGLQATPLLNKNSGISHSSEAKSMIAVRTILSQRIFARADVGPNPEDAATGSLRRGSDGGLEAVVSEISLAVGDGSNARVNLSRVRNLQVRHGLSDGDASALLFRSASLYRERVREGDTPVRRGGAYLFSIVEDLLARRRRGIRGQDGPGNDGSLPAGSVAAAAQHRAKNPHPTSNAAPFREASEPPPSSEDSSGLSRGLS
jgi:hypothetical protein